MAKTSLEARELDAARLLSMHAAEERDRITGSDGPERSPPMPEWRGFLGDARAMQAFAPPRATLFAEAWLTGATRGVRRRYVAARRGTALRLSERESMPFDALPSALMTERSAAKRTVIERAADELAVGLRSAALDVVAELREACATLGPDLRRRVGMGPVDAGEAIEATDELLREIDGYVLRAREVDASRLTWGERLHSMSAPAVTAAIPPATWAGLGLRMAERTGLDGVLRGASAALRPARSDGSGVDALVTAPGERVTVVGRPTVAGYGCGAVMEACGAATAALLGRGDSPGMRRGLDRDADGLIATLVRRLLLERGFLQREAGLDGAERARVMMEGLHAEVLRTRLDAALAGFVSEVLAGARELPTRFTEATRRALGVALPPSWAVVLAAEALEAAAPWGGHWMTRAAGAAVEPVLRAELRERFDEDWFRNPHAGMGIAGMVREYHALGTAAWAKAREAERAKALRERFDEALREARR